MLNLSDVTLCAVSGRALKATIAALDRAREVARFADTVLVTDQPLELESARDIRIALTGSLQSRERYSKAVLQDLADVVQTPFVMIVQWDGYPVRPGNWTDAFLDFDYIGAPWPQFQPARAVGNGGFSLRSRRLLEACRDPAFLVRHPEDLAICHDNRVLLEKKHGLRFAPVEVAARFSYERSGDPAASFGFHGVFNLHNEMDAADFRAFLQDFEWGDIGTRELCDLRDVIGLDADPTSASLSRHLLLYLGRHRWRDPLFWRHLTRGAIGPRTPSSPMPGY